MAYTFAMKKVGHPIISKAQFEAMNAAWPTCQQKIASCQTDTPTCADAQVWGEGCGGIE